MQHRLAELNEVFRDSQTNAETLKELENELQCRKSGRALLAQVQEAQAKLRGAYPTPASTPESGQTPQPSPRRESALWNLSTSGSGADEISPEASPLASDDFPMMTVEDAYKALRVSVASTWEVIEQSRRQLVQKAHPANLKGMSADKRAATKADAKLVNAAYTTLLRSRLTQ